MGFPENVLASNERVVKSLHPHWLTVFFPTVIAVVVIALGIFLLTITPADNTGTILNWVIVAVGVLVLVLFVLIPFLKWRTTHYVITTHRVMVRRGILNKQGKDVALVKITDVSFAQTLFDRIIRAGSLNIETAGDSPDESFKNIPNSSDVQQLINRLVDEDQRGTGEVHGGRGYPADPPQGGPGQVEGQPQTRPMTQDQGGWTPTG